MEQLEEKLEDMRRFRGFGLGPLFTRIQRDKAGGSASIVLLWIPPLTFGLVSCSVKMVTYENFGIPLLLPGSMGNLDRHVGVLLRVCALPGMFDLLVASESVNDWGCTLNTTVVQTCLKKGPRPNPACFCSHFAIACSVAGLFAGSSCQSVPSAF